MPKMVLGVWTRRFIGQDRLVRSRNYCCSSMRVASVDENKNSHWKITMTNTQTTCPNRIALRAGKKGARPAEVGALASVFEKSATELKQQKLLKCKHTIQIATFNVRTLNRIRQLPELTASAIGHNIDIICIQEYRYTHSEDIKYHDTGNVWTLATTSAWKNCSRKNFVCLARKLFWPLVLSYIFPNGDDESHSARMTFPGISNSVKARQTTSSSATFKQDGRISVCSFPAAKNTMRRAVWFMDPGVYISRPRGS